MLSSLLSTVLRGTALVALLSPFASSTLPDRTLEYECGDSSTIFEDGRWVQHVSVAQAQEEGTTVDDVALHLHLARERLKEDVACLYDCPVGSLPPSCQPYSSFDHEFAIGIPEPFTGGYNYAFGGVTALRGCHDCY